jgi:hypothetical protein
LGDLIVIKPRDLQFAFKFKKNECHKVLTGTCSLDEDFDQNKSKKVTNNKYDKRYCQRLYLALINNEVKFPDILIHKAGCGHYDFGNGRHRLCISQKRNLEILVEKTNDGDPLLCYDCENKNRRKDIKADLGEDFTIIVKL